MSIYSVRQDKVTAASTAPGLEMCTCGDSYIMGKICEVEHLCGMVVNLVPGVEKWGLWNL